MTDSPKPNPCDKTLVDDHAQTADQAVHARAERIAGGVVTLSAADQITPSKCQMNGMALPPDIRRRIKEYKKCTNHAVSAIYRVAVSGTFQPPTKAKNTSEGDKDVSEGAKHHMTAAELEEHVRFLVQLGDKSSRLPLCVSDSLETAARLRDEVTDLLIRRKLSDHATAADRDADRKHRWFSNYLREANKRLQSAGVFRSANSPAQETTPGLSKSEKISTWNAFSALDIEEPITGVSHFNRRPQPEVELEVPQGASGAGAEIVDSLLYAMKVFTDYQNDLESTRQEVRSAWTKAHDRKLDMCAAGVLANTAICFARTSEERISKFLDKFGGIYAFWDAYYASLSRPAPSVNKNVDDVELMTVLANYDRFLDNGYAAFHHSKVIQHTMRAGSLGMDPRFEHEFTIDHVSMRNTTSACVRYGRDQNLLLQVEKEVALAVASRGPGGATYIGSHVVDELMHHHLQAAMGLEETAPACIVFARQIYLDIAHILGEDIHRPFSELQAYCRSIKAPLERLQKQWQDEATKDKRAEFLRPSQKWPIESQIDCILEDCTLPCKRILVQLSSHGTNRANRKRNKPRHQIRHRNRPKRHRIRLRNRPKRHLGSDRSSRHTQARSRWRGCWGRKRCNCAKPETFRALKWHPVLCALLLWSVRHKQQEIGIEVSRCDFSITAAISMYDFLIQERYAHTEPSDFALLRRLHGDGSFFHGGEPPRPERPLQSTKQRRCYEFKYYATMGFIPNGQTSVYRFNSEISPHLARGKNSLVKGGQKAMTPIIPVHADFESQFGRLAIDRRRDWIPASIMEVVSKSRWVISMEGDDIVMKPKAPNARTRTRKNPSAAKALKCLGTALHAEAWEASLPYFEMNLECKAFLEKLRRVGESKGLTSPGLERAPFRDQWTARTELPAVCMNLWARNENRIWQSGIFEAMGEVAQDWATREESQSCRRTLTQGAMGFIPNNELEPFLGT